MVITSNSITRQGSFKTEKKKSVSEKLIKDILYKLLKKDKCEGATLTITEDAINIERIHPLTLHSFLLELEKLRQTFEIKKKLTINLI